jgi:hypothetical protein
MSWTLPEPLMVAPAYSVSGASSGPSGLMTISRGPTILSTVHTSDLPANDTTTPGAALVRPAVAEQLLEPQHRQGLLELARAAAHGGRRGVWIDERACRRRGRSGSRRPDRRP